MISLDRPDRFLAWTALGLSATVRGYVELGHISRQVVIQKVIVADADPTTGRRPDHLTAAG